MSIGAYFEMIGGASGNMILGSLVDAGADLETILKALRTIPVSGWEVEHERVRKRGISATFLDFFIPGEDQHRPDPHRAPYDREHHHHEHVHDHEHDYRTLADIVAIVEKSGLTARQKERAAAIYTRLAKAEAKVHGSTYEAIEFHEVGQVDAILDVAGACVALDILGIDEVYCSPYPIGEGRISMFHGSYPNPAPATAELMTGAPTVATGVKAELVTTTGAAILSTFVARPGERPSLRYDRIGYGAGSNDFAIPNVLRVEIGELAGHGAEGLRVDSVVVLETNVDDMSPQYFELALERVYEAGAFEAWLTATTTKKSRPGLVFSAIAPPQRAEACATAMLAHTSSLGVRFRRQERYVLEREIATARTPLGDVRYKTATIEGRPRRSLEYDDVARIARETGRPPADVARELERYLPNE
jgi:pyridinium-3,5-bisthiocarboxylic acid mononucleotide nickel chelatase